MNYKKIIRNRNIRNHILNMLNWIPDKTMLKIQYRIKMDRKLNLENPKRFSEKLQWYKLYYKNPLMIKCVDKYDVRDYIKKCGLEEILIPCYGVYDNFNDINWDELPNSFVIKDTLGSGGNDVLIIKNKKSTNVKEVQKQCNSWVKKPLLKNGGREWPYYSGKKHRIMIEKYIGDTDKEGLLDYKFFCFNGITEMLYVMSNRVLGDKVKVGLFNSNFEKLNVSREDKETLDSADRPVNFEKMKEISFRLSSSFPHARIDLYNIKGKIYFGEITFYCASGYLKYNPDSYDFELGEKFLLKEYESE